MAKATVSCESASGQQLRYEQKINYEKVKKAHVLLSGEVINILGSDASIWCLLCYRNLLHLLLRYNISAKGVFLWLLSGHIQCQTLWYLFSCFYDRWSDRFVKHRMKVLITETASVEYKWHRGSETGIAGLGVCSVFWWLVWENLQKYSQIENLKFVFCWWNCDVHHDTDSL